MRAPEVMRAIIVSILCGLMPGAWADTLTVEQAVALGLAQSYGIRIARNEARQADNTRALKIGKLLPNASAEASAAYTDVEQEQPATTAPNGPGQSLSGGGTEETTYSAGVSVGWTLFDGFRMFYAYRLVEQQARQTETASRQEIESAVVAVVTAYYELAGARSLLDAAREQLSLSRSQAELMQAQWEYGRVSKRDLLAQQVVVNADSAAVAARELEAVEALHTLNVSLGRPVAAPLTTVIDSTPAAPEHEASFWFEKAVEHNAGLRISDIRRNIAASQAGIARAAFWPVLSARGSYTHTFGDTPSDRISAGLSLNWTLFNGFERQTTLRNARIDVENATLAHEEQKLQLEALISQQWERLVNAYHQTLFEREAVALARKTVALGEEQFGLGRISRIDLRESQLALLDARVRLESALFQNKIVAVQLEQLAGMLSF